MKTKQRTLRQGRQAAAICGLALAIIFTMATAFPAGADTGVNEQAWQEQKPAQPVSPQKVWERLMASVQNERSARSTTSETQATPEIEELARGLRHDPKLIFDYVHNHIDYTPTFGSIKGATGTYWSGRGNDCDQASLFIALMRASGYTANYVIGNVAYNDLSRLANWLGADADPSVIVNVLANGGIPSETGIDGAVILRIWAEAVIDGKTYTFDPAMKEHRIISGIGDLKTAMGYDRTKLLSDAQSGATVAADYVQNINETNIRKDMAAYAANLVSHLKNNYPAASLKDIIGGKEIITSEIKDYPTELPYIMTVIKSQKFSDMSDILRHTLRVRFMGIDHTFYSYEIAKERLTISYIPKDETGVVVTPVLKLDGNIAVSGPETDWGGEQNMTLTVNHPYDDLDGTFADQEASHEISLSNASVAAIVHDFDMSSPALIAHRNKLMSAAVFGGAKQGTEALLGESLSLMGLSYVEEVRLFNRLLDRLGNTVTYNHHFIGIVGQSHKYYFDLPMKSVSTVSKSSADFRPPFRLRGLMCSAYEHGVLEQMQGTQAASTIKMLQLHNASGGKIFSAKQSNWNTVKPQLSDYYSSELSDIFANFADFNIGPYLEYLLPANGNISLGEWRGSAYIAYYDNNDANSVSMTMKIAGNIHGGSGSKNCDSTTGENCVDPEKIKEEIEKGKIPPEKKAEEEVPKSEDPVEMAGGAFNYRSTDLSFGFSEPLGLSFTRTYSSEDQYNLSPLGYGWAHNYEMSAGIHSDGDTALGARGAADAAAMIAYITAGLDLLKDKPTPAVWMTSVLSTLWAMDQLTDNAVTVQWGGQSLKFIKLPDGQYNPPPGMTIRLTSDTYGYHLQDSNGQRIDFDASSLNATSWQDANGNKLTFSYDTEGRLTKITDAFAKTLTLTYTGDKVTSLTDFAGRSVKYVYTNNNLTTYYDAENQPWSYAYDTANRMTKVFKPDPGDKPLVVNAYDSFGRVITQTDGLGNVTEFFFSGYRNTERFADGTEVTHFMDTDGRYIARQDQQGKRLTFAYDGLGRETASTDRAGNTTVYTYHEPSGQVATVTDAEGQATRYSYGLRTGSDVIYNLTRSDYPDGTNEQFAYNAKGNLLTMTDSEGQIWQYAYDSRGLLTQTKNPAGGITDYIYNTDGTLASFADSDTGKTLFDYNPYGQLTQTTYPDGSKTTAAYDRLGHLTSFTDQNGVKTAFDYDANGNLTRTDSPNNIITYQYDIMNHAVRISDNSTTFAYTYNNMGRLASVTEPGNVKSEYAYDPRGWLDSITQNGNSWKTGYDDEGIPISFTTPMNRMTRHETDKQGYLVKITDPLGNAVRFARDAMNRTASVTDPLNRRISYGYDRAGSLTDVTLPLVGKAEYFRDGSGIITQIRDLNGSLWNFKHSLPGRLLAVTDPLNRQIQYAYNSGGILNNIIYPDSATQDIVYDPAGNITQRSFSGGLSLDFAYNSDNLLISANHLTLTRNSKGRTEKTEDAGVYFSAVYSDDRMVLAEYNNRAFSVSYGYDENTGLLKTVSCTSPADVNYTFTYNADRELVGIQRSNDVNSVFSFDNAGRLTRIQEGAFIDIVYTLDAAGQVIQADMTAPLVPSALITERAESFSYNAASQISTAGYAFDLQGKQTASPGTSFVWDAASRLTRIGNVNLTYNGMGDLLTRNEGAKTIRYYYNYGIGLAPIVAEKDDGAGQFLRFYVWTPAGQLLFMIDAANGNKVYHYHFDRTGSTLALTDSSKTVTDSYAYDPYGRLLKHEGANSQPFTFVGRYGHRQESPTLYQMRARYYDATAGRFLSRDPVWPRIGNPKLLNPYPYAMLAPTNYVDINGLVPIKNDEVLRVLDIDTGKWKFEYNFGQVKKDFAEKGISDEALAELVHGKLAAGEDPDTPSRFRVSRTKEFDDEQFSEETIALQKKEGKVQDMFERPIKKRKAYSEKLVRSVKVKGVWNGDRFIPGAVLYKQEDRMIRHVSEGRNENGEYRVTKDDGAVYTVFVPVADPAIPASVVSPGFLRQQIHTTDDSHKVHEGYGYIREYASKKYRTYP